VYASHNFVCSRMLLYVNPILLMAAPAIAASSSSLSESKRYIRVVANLAVLCGPDSANSLSRGRCADSWRGPKVASCWFAVLVAHWARTLGAGRSADSDSRLGCPAPSSAVAARVGRQRRSGSVPCAFGRLAPSTEARPRHLNHQ
jgi:hypothetical protein